MIHQVFKMRKWSKYNVEGQPRQATWTFTYDKGGMPNFKKIVEDAGFRIIKYTADSSKLEFESIEKMFGKVIRMARNLM